VAVNNCAEQFCVLRRDSNVLKGDMFLFTNVGIVATISNLTLDGGEILNAYGTFNTAANNLGISGAIVNNSRTLQINDGATLRWNYRNSGNSNNGGGIVSIGTLQINGGKVSQNHASNWGGGIFFSGTLTTT
jgi:hypothetical protein